MSKKVDKELLELDLYEILEISLDADEKEIKKSFRKKALACHPDKNPDNPDAAIQFQRLKKILEIFLDPGARRAYDKVLKGRKAAALRAKESNLKSQKLRSELEQRERAQAAKPQISEQERLRREFKRLEQEGEKLIEEEMESLNREAEAQVMRAFRAGGGGVPSYASEAPVRHHVKARWTSTEEGAGYTKEEIEKLFYKWGEINEVVMRTKGTKNTALIEFKTKSGADMALQFEKGQVGKPLEVLPSEKPEERKKAKSRRGQPEVGSSRDFESIASMNMRREKERQWLIDEMKRMEGDL